MRQSYKAAGCFKSDLSNVASAEFPEMELPSKYDLRDELDNPWDQGNRGICVSVCMTDMISYMYRFFEKKYKKSLDYFYRKRSDTSQDGMSVREAFEIADKDGFVKTYAAIRNKDQINTAIFANGPILAVLPVYNFNKSQFWLPDPGIPKILGYHAITFVGFEPEFLILRNSWGTGWQDGGYIYFTTESLNSILEIWTMFV